MPDPFVLAIGLTFVVGALGMLLGSAFQSGALAGADWLTRLEVTTGGFKSLFFGEAAPYGPTAGKPVNRKLLYFAFQMCLMLVTGHALASSPPIARLVRRLACAATTFRRGLLLVSGTACAMALVHWGLGLIVGAMIAREVGANLARNHVKHHYPLLGAAGYTGLMVWGGGLSGSIPLAAAGQKGIDINSTLFSTTNLIISGALLIAVPVFCSLLAGRDETAFVPFKDNGESGEDEASERTEGGMAVFGTVALLTLVADLWANSLSGPGGIVTAIVNAIVVGAVGWRIFSLVSRKKEAADTPAARLENSEWIAIAICVVALGQLEIEVLRGDFKLSLNNLNFLFLFAGLLFQGTPIRYVGAVSNAARGCAGIILQFPLYFGILGIMIATGLGVVISTSMAQAATEATYPIMTYFSAGLVNLFVPSGGGQWAVQGAIVIEGANALAPQSAALVSKSILALTYGDALTNMLQPFWAVPLLAITGLRARDIIGYTAAIMVQGGALTIALLLLL
ncbi:MAG: short-chain fatty acids transporter [Myxococcota bacterium]|jgi:short-chain fatty acids transporter